MSNDGFWGRGGKYQYVGTDLKKTKVGFHDFSIKDAENGNFILAIETHESRSQFFNYKRILFFLFIQTMSLESRH